MKVKPPPFVAAIVDRINAVRPQSQCPSTFTKGMSTSFCTKRKGHEGDHRGYRAQWNETRRVKITEKES